MKHLESLISILNQKDDLKYKVGDYILFSRSWKDISDEPVIIVSLFKGGYHCSFVNKQPNGMKSCNVLPEEISRKLSDIEINAIKYNL